jgi:uncharacterized protein YozE (UPF0346 family)
MSKFKTFHEWLVTQKNQKSPIGELAGSLVRDQSFPKDVQSVDALLSYLREKQAPSVTVATAKIAWQTYARSGK